MRRILVVVLIAVAVTTMPWVAGAKPRGYIGGGRTPTGIGAPKAPVKMSNTADVSGKVALQAPSEATARSGPRSRPKPAAAQPAIVTVERPASPAGPARPGGPAGPASPAK